MESHKAQSLSRLGTPNSVTSIEPHKIVRLQNLKIWKKMKDGDLHLVTKENVNDLFKIMDAEDRGDFAKEDLFILKQVPGVPMTESDLDAIANDCDKEDSGRITEPELYKAITEGELAFRMMKDSLGKNPKVGDERTLELKKVIEYLNDEFATSTALWSLPQTLLLFTLFLVLMSGHLDVTKAYEMNLTLVKEITTETGEVFLRDSPPDIHDTPTFWLWMSGPFTTLFFKNSEAALDFFPYPGRVASYNQMIGGVRLTKTQVKAPMPCDQSETLRFAYDSQNGYCHRSSKSSDNEDVSAYFLYHEGPAAIQAQVAELMAARWIDSNTSSVLINVLFYNAQLQAFTDCRLTISFDLSGYVTVTDLMETWHSDPYYNKAWVLPDFIFICIIMRMLWSETQEIIPAFRSGLDGLIGYMEFWNIIDWLSIIFGGIVMASWGMICITVSGSLQDALQTFPQRDLDGLVLQNRTYLTVEELSSVVSVSAMEDKIGALHEITNALASQHQNLRYLVFWYSFILMMKFFKAFQANPRLDIVIRTLTKSAVEIIHFLIVFLVIFLVFSSSGYVVFGGRITGFRDQYTAMANCWSILMGAYDLALMEKSSVFYAYVWLFSFQFMVLLILLNMLLAIIMDTYTRAKEEAGDPENQLTIWAQIRDACFAVRETRGHIKPYDLLLALQDEDYPAHPLPGVTSKSLRRAFSKMTKHQSDYIMKKTLDFLRAQSSELEFDVNDTVRVLSVLKVNTLRTGAQLNDVHEMMKSQSRHTQAVNMDAIMEGEDNQQNQQNQQKGLNRLAGAGGGQLALTMPSLPGMVPSTGTVPSQSRAYTPSITPPQSAFGTNRSAGGVTPGDVTGLPPGTAEILAMLMEIRDQQKETAEDQRILNANVAQQLAATRQYCEERDSWLETRINALDRRCANMFLASEKILTTLDGVDFGELMEVPRKLEDIIPRRGPQGMTQGNQVGFAGGRGASPPTMSHPKSDGSEGSDDEEEESSPAVASGVSSSGLAPGLARRVDKQLESINKQLEELLSHATEASEQRKLLWKIDIGIRQFRQETKDLPKTIFDMMPKDDLTNSRRANLKATLQARKGGGAEGTLREAAAEGGGTPMRLADSVATQRASPQSSVQPPRKPGIGLLTPGGSK